MWDAQRTVATTSMEHCYSIHVAENFHRDKISLTSPLSLAKSLSAISSLRLYYDYVEHM